MTILFSKKCLLAIKAVLYLSTLAPKKLVNAADISGELKVPKEFVSKVLQILTIKEIVGSKKGKNGGFFLSKLPDSIKLIDIIQAIDGLSSLESCVLGFQNCGKGLPCPLHNQWSKLLAETINMLSSHSLEEFKEVSANKINELRID